MLFTGLIPVYQNTCTSGTYPLYITGAKIEGVLVGSRGRCLFTGDPLSLYVDNTAIHCVNDTDN